MHEKVREFVEKLHANPPADLAEFLRAHEMSLQDHLAEFDLDDLSDPRHARRVEDARRVLPELKRRAGQGSTLTFTEFVDVVGRGNPRTTNGKAINPIVALCLTDGLPPLWTLVVSAATGLGSGYWREHTDEEKIARQEECFAAYGARRASPLPRPATARRQPDVVARETCPDCYTELTPAGTCLC
jgi:hypothetical protein